MIVLKRATLPGFGDDVVWILDGPQPGMWLYADDPIAPASAKNRAKFKDRLDGYVGRAVQGKFEGLILPLGRCVDPTERPQRLSMAALNVEHVLKTLKGSMLIGVEGTPECGSAQDLYVIRQRLKTERFGGCFVGKDVAKLQELHSSPGSLLRAVITSGLPEDPITAYLKGLGALAS